MALRCRPLLPRSPASCVALPPWPVVGDRTLDSEYAAVVVGDDEEERGDVFVIRHGAGRR
jgi:hypothetical protein